MSTCAADCDRPVYCKGYCTQHYQRVNKYGDPTAVHHGGRRFTPEERLAGNIEREDENGCWIWGSKSSGGYGVITIRDADGRERRPRAHRWVYEYMVGEIPEGLHLDHLCRNRICVNPWHLEPVTQRENNRRAWDVRPPERRHIAPVNTVQAHAVLTEDQVREIKALIAEGARNCDLARRYGVHKSSIADIRHGRSWTWLAAA